MIKQDKVVLLVGSSGYIGKKVKEHLASEGYHVICLIRQIINKSHRSNPKITYFKADICKNEDINELAKILPNIDYVISCIASKTGGIKDSWAVDFEGNNNLLNFALEKKVSLFILLSAICVQKPKLAFQRAKLAFESQLVRSGMPYSIVRPTAFFKSISGQIERVKSGKPFLLFDNGQKTACKPISETDLAIFITDCITNTSRLNKVLPIGGPGPAITPLDQGKLIFELLGKDPYFRRIPSFIFYVFGFCLLPFAIMSCRIQNLREFTKIAHYYSTESMLVWNEQKNCYDQNMTPEFGKDTIKKFYEERINGNIKPDNLGNQKMF